MNVYIWRKLEDIAQTSNGEGGLTIIANDYQLAWHDYRWAAVYPEVLREELPEPEFQAKLADGTVRVLVTVFPNDH